MVSREGDHRKREPLGPLIFFLCFLSKGPCVFIMYCAPEIMHLALPLHYLQFWVYYCKPQGKDYLIDFSLPMTWQISSGPVEVWIKCSFQPWLDVVRMVSGGAKGVVPTLRIIFLIYHLFNNCKGNIFAWQFLGPWGKVAWGPPMKYSIEISMFRIWDVWIQSWASFPSRHFRKCRDARMQHTMAINGVTSLKTWERNPEASLGHTICGRSILIKG